MRKLVVSTFMTLDGVMQAPGGPEEDPTGGFEHGGWSVTYWDNVMYEVMGAAFQVPFDLLLGRRTYEIFAAHWPHVTGEDHPEYAGAVVLNRATKYVASRTLKESDLTWNNSRLVKDVPKEVAKLKQGDGVEIQVHGSSDLIQTLLRHDLVDELRVWTFPLVIGRGKRLFGDGTQPRGLKLVESRMSTTGVAIATYHPAGAVPVGSFALENPTPAEVERREKLARG
jgi:dihydrofolate reductase